MQGSNPQTGVWIEFAAVAAIKAGNQHDLIAVRIDGGQIYALPAELLSSLIGHAEPSAETKRDEESEYYFSKGWVGALKECALQHDNGNIRAFLKASLEMEADDEPVDTNEFLEIDAPTDEEIVAYNKTQDAFQKLNEADGLSDFPTIRELIDYNEPFAHAVKDSGEPEKEAMPTTASDSHGDIMMPYEDYQNELAESYRRGFTEGERSGMRNSLTHPRQTTKRTLDMIVREIHAENGGTPPSSFVAAYKLAQRLGFTVNQLTEFGEDV